MKHPWRGAGWGCLAVLGVVSALAAASGATTGCTTHQCDQDPLINIDQSTGMTIGDMRVLSDGLAIWESSPIDGTWIDFPGQRFYFFGLPANFTPLSPPVAYVSTGPTPGDADASSPYVLASGELAVLGPFVNGGFLISNGSCAEYYLYVTVTGTYTPPPPPPDDAGD